MTALVITHSSTEGPGLLSDWLPEAGLALTVCQPWNGQPLPSLDEYSALVVMGGPQQAYDDSSAGWLRDTKDLLRTAVAQQLPVLAICLGAQLLAQATGGTVRPGAHGPELGARLVAKRDVAGADPLFWDLPLSPAVVQWHWDTVVELPAAATLLMSSTAYPHQAFRVGTNAWGLQFHIEADPTMITNWVAADQHLIAQTGLEPQQLLAGTLAELEEIGEVWGEVARRFARLARTD